MATGSRWLSIVTVVKDDPTGLARTLESIVVQDCAGAELVVIDSSSDESSVPAIIRGRVLQDSCPVTYRHEPPRGIYPAMNSGLASAQGDYVLFLNAGDAFDASHVVASLSALVEREAPAWLVGRVRVVGPSGRDTVSATWDYRTERKRSFARGLFPPHQGTVARRELLNRAGGFDTTYAIAADYAMALRLSTFADPTMTELVIARFVEGGVSTERWKESFREFHRARREICRPTGVASLREQWDTRVHFARVFAYREVLSRLPRGAR